MKKISQSTWDGLRLAYFTGAGLRELARASGLVESTVTAYASRHRWAALREKGRAVVPADPAAVSPEETIQNLMAVHKERFQTGTAKAIAKAACHAAELEPAEALEQSRRLADLVQAGAKLHGLGQAETQVAVHVLNQW